MKINVLPQSIANMIAAGEVVERPASVVKELVENSIDAGAKSVTVEIKMGGMAYIRITDDGCGIEPDEVETAFLRHATSKISKEEDLNAIYTLGFRGEALARVDIFTKTKANDFGKCVSIEGGEIISSDEAGCADGTTLIVRDLFFNTPARMKFLKSDATETGYVTDTVNKLILSNPSVSIRLIVNGRQTVISSGDGKLENAVYSVYGKDYPRHMSEVSYSDDGIEVTGLVGNSTLARKDRRQQVFFINGRYISSKVISAALSEAFQNVVMVGKFPVAVLMIKVSGNFVDVNVHPTKTEVRFSDDKKVYQAVYWAVKNSLSSKKYVPEIEIKKKDSQNAAAVAKAGEAKVKNESTQIDINFLRDSFFASMNKDADAHMEETKAEKKETAPEVKATEKKSSQKPVSASVPKEKKEEKISEITSEEISSHIKNNAFFSKDGMLNLRSEPTISYETTKDEKKEQPEIITAKDEKPTPGSVAKTEDISSVSAELTSEKETEQDCEIKENPINLPVPGVDFRLVGQIFATYIIVQKGDEMLIIDQHAAHERMYFEELLKEAKEKQISSQRLLIPVTVSFEPQKFPLVCENLSFFEDLGFECEEFGESAIVVRTYPASIGDADIKDTVLSIADLIDKNCVDIKKTLMEDALHTMACKRAIKGNRVLEKAEMESLVQKVLGFDYINTCPHGRPICVSMTKYEMEKQFKRIV